MWFLYKVRCLPFFFPALGWIWCHNAPCPTPCSHILSSLRSDFSSPSKWSLLCLVFRWCSSWWQNHGGSSNKWELNIGNYSFVFLKPGIQKGWEVWTEVALITVALVIITMVPGTKKNDPWHSDKAGWHWHSLQCFILASSFWGLLIPSNLPEVNTLLCSDIPVYLRPSSSEERTRCFRVLLCVLISPY